jgi:hypothetical protein
LRTLGRFLQIVKASSDEAPDKLIDAVPDAEYRSAFLKITRNLAPTGKSFDELEIRSPGDQSGVTLRQESRSNINNVLRSRHDPGTTAAEVEETLKGVLRAVHLDQDWLDVTVGDQSVHVSGLKDSLDDVVGPMVNRSVNLRVAKHKNKYRLIDIETDE